MKNAQSIIEILKSAGLETTEAIGIFGRYYDGIDREIECNTIRFRYDFMLNGWNRYNEIMQALERIMKRKTVSLHMTSATCSGIAAGYIVASEDAEKIERAERIASKFQTAFWLAIHEGKAQSEAIEAGRRAIA